MLTLSIVLAGLFTWLLYETDWLRVRLPLYTQAEHKLSFVISPPFDTSLTGDPDIDSVLETISDIIIEADGDLYRLCAMLELETSDIETELGLRSMPYHGRAKALFAGVKTKVLDAQLILYNKFADCIVASEV